MKIAKFSERLAEAMRIREVSQTELHNRTGINKSSISAYLKNEYEAKQNKVYEIAKALNVNEAWLMGYDIEMNAAPAATPTKTLALTPDEHHLVTDYRRLTPDGKEYVRDQVIFRLNKEAEEREEADKKDA